MPSHYNIVKLTDSENGVVDDCVIGFGDWLLYVNKVDPHTEYVCVITQVDSAEIGIISLTGKHWHSEKSKTEYPGGLADSNRMCSSWKMHTGSKHDNFSPTDIKKVLECNNEFDIYDVYKINVEIVVILPNNLESNKILDPDEPTPF